MQETLRLSPSSQQGGMLHARAAAVLASRYAERLDLVAERLAEHHLAMAR